MMHIQARIILFQLNKVYLGNCKLWMVHSEEVQLYWKQHQQLIELDYLAIQAKIILAYLKLNSILARLQKTTLFKYYWIQNLITLEQVLVPFDYKKNKPAFLKHIQRILLVCKVDHNMLLFWILSCLYLIFSLLWLWHQLL